MAREKGTLPISANFEPQTASPFDARLRVLTKAELLLATTWTASDSNIYAYVGMLTVVYDDGVNNGVYKLNTSDYTDINNWEKIGDQDLSGLQPKITITEGNIVIGGAGNTLVDSNIHYSLIGV